eukprot:scaffold1572_cov272-Pinguiococcus_pyrenoidosus.AAC.9
MAFMAVRRRHFSVPTSSKDDHELRNARGVSAVSPFQSPFPLPSTVRPTMSARRVRACTAGLLELTVYAVARVSSFLASESAALAFSRGRPLDAKR